jgi:hypothetical protein
MSKILLTHDSGIKLSLCIAIVSLPHEAKVCGLEPKGK